MTTRTVSLLALIASLGLAQPVFAQADQPQPDAAAQPPAVAAPVDQQSAAPEAKADKSAVASVNGQIMLQEDNTFLASDFIGTTVYSSQDERLGDVNDLIVARDGTVQGVVIGVGGFLGLGEKDVALTLDRLQMTDTDTGIKLSVDATSEELADAEPFKSRLVQKVESDTERTRMEQENRATDPASPDPAAAPAEAQ